MNLSNITLGQYFPGNSPVHKLDPRYKILLTLLFIVTLFLAGGLITYLVCAAFLIGVILISRISLRMVLKSIAPIGILILITAVLNIFYTPGETELLSFWVFRITLEGVYSALRMIARIAMLVAGSSILTYTTSPILLTDAIESLLSPLRVLHVPVHEISMMMSIALRFIPTLIEEADKIMSAQKARGADFESGNLLRRVKAMIPLLIPLFVSAFRRADELALAMECRCYNGGEGRTRLHTLKASPRDHAIFFSVLLLFVAVSVAGRFGY
ncbi:MAG: energy-coupling factor transporter transmembrane protein EcfT [Clostridia bacterium]|nr:energy-coupling factor transporter transmembrane protein EcfT [Clostridia bacterium]